MYNVYIELLPAAAWFYRECCQSAAHYIITVTYKMSTKTKHKKINKI